MSARLLVPTTDQVRAGGINTRLQRVNLAKSDEIIRPREYRRIVSRLDGREPRSLVANVRNEYCAEGKREGVFYEFLRGNEKNLVAISSVILNLEI